MGCIYTLEKSIKHTQAHIWQAQAMSTKILKITTKRTTRYRALQRLAYAYTQPKNIQHGILYLQQIHDARAARISLVFTFLCLARLVFPMVAHFKFHSYCSSSLFCSLAGSHRSSICCVICVVFSLFLYGCHSLYFILLSISACASRCETAEQLFSYTSVYKLEKNATTKLMPVNRLIAIWMKTIFIFYQFQFHNLISHNWVSAYLLLLLLPSFILWRIKCLVILHNWWQRTIIRNPI